MFHRFAAFTTMLCAALSSTPNLQAQQSEVKNIVLVHGAWADGSCWSGVIERLHADGFQRRRRFRGDSELAGEEEVYY